MTKRKRYTDKFRAGAIVMLEANGYPDKKGALATVSNHLSVPQATLHRWFHGKNNPAPELSIDMANQVFESIVAKSINKIADSIDDLSLAECLHFVGLVANGLGNRDPKNV